MDNALLKAIGIGIGVFVVMILIFWGISKFTNSQFISVPKRQPKIAVTPAPTVPPFLR